MAAAKSQIVVLDAGGQYCHLIARRVRELGVYATVVPSDAPAASLEHARGLIISGGPSSVYDPASPCLDSGTLHAGVPVLGICYGLQLMAHSLGGSVQKGEKGEYGLALLDLTGSDALLDGVQDHQQVWMSHRDRVEAAPAEFTVTGRTDTCPVAAMSDPVRKLYAVQFHPEVVHTRPGTRILTNFVFGVCGCEKDWNPVGQIEEIEQQIRDVAGDRNVFFFVSGGVDSTVAYHLCVQALGAARVRGAYVDTGLMRGGETSFVRRMFDDLGAEGVTIEQAADRFLRPLAGVVDPEAKRRAIGEEFVKVQEEIIEQRHLLDGHWILGQGTIYPDTIESGGTANAAVIKTHHNRVEGVQRLKEANRLVEPLASLYKDEVRRIGRELGLPAEFLERHPFPGPGLAIRCLCADKAEPLRRVPDGWIVPVRTVGVQGDSRTYAPALAIEQRDLKRAVELINTHREINRVISLAAARGKLEDLQVYAGHLDAVRLERLRQADAIVRRISAYSGFDREIWQFPVVLIPAGFAGAPDSVVLRPIDSVDGMTAQAVPVPEPVLREMTAALLALNGIAAVFEDLTNKPPATIEWE